MSFFSSCDTKRSECLGQAISACHRKARLNKRNIFISCIIPTYNESLLIKEFLHALKAQLQQLSDSFELLVIDDGSQDETAQLITEMALQFPEIKLVRFSRNFGKESAISAGLHYCKGEVAVIIDADFQHPINIIPIFLDKWSEGYQMIYGVRKDREDETALKRFFARSFYRLMKWLMHEKIPAHAGDFRLLDRKVINALNQCKERIRFMKGLYAWAGYATSAVYFKAAQRPKGKSRHPYRRLTALAITGIISFSDIPLRIWSFIGLTISILSFFSILYIIINTLVYGIGIPGYATLLITIIFFGGVQLLSIGILGEYIARIFHEVKKRPPYLIEKLINLDD